MRLYADQWGLRRLFSLAIRRRSSPRKRKDIMAEEFFKVLVDAWGGKQAVPAKKKPRSEEKAIEEAEDETAVVDPAQLSDADVSEGCDVQLVHAETDAYLVEGETAALPADPPAAEGDEGEDDMEELLLLKRIEQLRLLAGMVYVFTHGLKYIYIYI